MHKHKHKLVRISVEEKTIYYLKRLFSVHKNELSAKHITTIIDYFTLVEDHYDC